MSYRNTPQVFLCLLVHTQTQKAQSLSHIDTESCQSTDSVFPAVKLTVLSIPPGLVFNEVASSYLFSVHAAYDCLLTNGTSFVVSLAVSLLVAWQLAVTLHSFRAVMEITLMALFSFSQLWLGDTFIMLSLHYSLRV